MKYELSSKELELFRTVLTQVELPKEFYKSSLCLNMTKESAIVKLSEEAAFLQIVQEFSNNLIIEEDNLIVNFSTDSDYSEYGSYGKTVNQTGAEPDGHILGSSKVSKDLVLKGIEEDQGDINNPDTFSEYILDLQPNFLEEVLNKVGEKVEPEDLLHFHLYYHFRFLEVVEKNSDVFIKFSVEVDG